jgi:hypothetical protein
VLAGGADFVGSSLSETTAAAAEVGIDTGGATGIAGSGTTGRLALAAGGGTGTGRCGIEILFCGVLAGRGKEAKLVCGVGGALWGNGGNTVADEEVASAWRRCAAAATMSRDDSADAAVVADHPGGGGTSCTL